MAHTIWKYKLTAVDIQAIAMPEGAHVLHAGLDPQGDLCVWAIVDPGRGEGLVRIAIVPTGAIAAHLAGNWRHVGTSIVEEKFIMHVFVEEK